MLSKHGNEWHRSATIAALVLGCVPTIAGCGPDDGGGGTTGAGGSAGQGTGGSTTDGGTGGVAGQPEGGTGGSSGQGTDGGDAGATPKCEIFADYNHPIEKLTETGCVDPNDPTKPMPYMIPYEVNSPLWSDSADKQRFMRIPDGTKIHVLDCSKEQAACGSDPFPGVDGHWNYPVGTVMMKIFGFEGTTVETRLLMKFDDTNWVGYSYKWNQEQTEATVLPNARDTATFQVGPSKRSQEWNYPSRGDCSTCHTDYSGVTLGTETAQFNRMETGGKNQLERLEEAGILDAALTRPFLEPYLLPTGTDGSLEDRARSYLHANCSYCHRPDGGQPKPDFRYTRPFDFKKMGVCNQPPGRGDLGVTSAQLLVPEHPELSVISLRMKSLDPEARMPQIATVIEDEKGRAAVDDWIKSVTKCPP
jgi:uncharacterized repeat protein (TIGR03806 family)